MQQMELEQVERRLRNAHQEQMTRQAKLTEQTQQLEARSQELERQIAALLFERPAGFRISVLANLFGTPLRVALGMGKSEVKELREIGRLLALLKEPEPPRGWRDLWDKLPLLKQVLSMVPTVVSAAPCRPWR